MAGVILVLAVCALALSSQAQTLSGKPWVRHTIDHSARGADGVRLGDTNADGLLDVVTGWEESGVIRVYLNPGKEVVKSPWPIAHVGRVDAPEDAVPVDLDGDGKVDVVSSCESDTRAIFVHWAPRDASGEWTTEKFTTAPGLQWMFAMPLQADNTNGVDLVVGSKGRNAKIGWLASPKDARELSAWRFHELADAGWVMTITAHDVDRDGDTDVIFSDRKEKGAGVHWVENPGPGSEKAWRIHAIGALGREVMFLDVADLDEDGRVDIVVATKLREVIILRQGTKAVDRWQVESLRLDGLPIGSMKAVTVADVDLDGRQDLIVTCEGATDRRSGVVWIRLEPTSPANSEAVFDISGVDGVKFDLAPVMDLDGDGDLDVITTEETENLGVVWYENPRK